MATRLDGLVVAWALVGEALAKADRARMGELLEIAQTIARAHGVDAGPIAFATTGVVDLESSTDAT